MTNFEILHWILDIGHLALKPGVGQATLSVTRPRGRMPPRPGVVPTQRRGWLIAIPQVSAAPLLPDLAQVVADDAVAVAEDRAVRADLVEPRPEGPGTLPGRQLPPWLVREAV